MAATLALDPAALTEMSTDDAVFVDPIPPAAVGKQAMRARADRLAADKEVNVLSYVPEYQELPRTRFARR